MIYQANLDRIFEMKHFFRETSDRSGPDNIKIKYFSLKHFIF